MNTPLKLPLLTRALRAGIALTIDTLGLAAMALRAVDVTLTNRGGAVPHVHAPPVPEAPFWAGIPAEERAAAEVTAQLVGLGWPAEEIRWSVDDHNGVVTVMAQVPLEKSGSITTTTRRLHRSKERGDSDEDLHAARLALLIALIEDARVLRAAPMVATIDPRAQLGQVLAPAAAPAIVAPTAAPEWTEKQRKIVEEIYAAALKSGWSQPTSGWTWTVGDLGNGNHSVEVNAFNAIATTLRVARANGSSLDGALRNLRDQLEEPAGSQ